MHHLRDQISNNQGQCDEGREWYTIRNPIKDGYEQRGMIGYSRLLICKNNRKGASQPVSLLEANERLFGSGLHKGRLEYW